jgi:outer membrane protein
MTWRLVFVSGALALLTHMLPMQGRAQSVSLVLGSPSSNTLRLSVKDAEALALKNNPAISVARLTALASEQVTREARSNFWPQATANLTGVDAHNNSRITAGGLNNPTVYTRAAGGAAISQLITDFGHTSNMVGGSGLL